MPLFKKREPFALSEPPKEMEPHELVFQIRFTKEIFCDYGEYLNRINLYRQRVWTCKVTGKSNLTYEEALVAEKLAEERVQHLPKELMAPTLGIIQFSMLPLKDLADRIFTKLQGFFYVGAELHGKKDGDIFPCKIVKILEGAERSRYEVSWLGGDNEIIETAIVNEEDLVQKKLPYSRNFFKCFIRESTYRYSPWVIHNELAQKHGISTDPPKELRDIVYFQNGFIVRNKKRRKEDKYNAAEDDQADESLKYPIEDLLVQPGEDDPVFTDRPSPSRDFNIPMDCVGDLLMVWDFCSSFGRLLNLSPFSLGDFENAVCHKDSNLVLVVESHMALLQLLINDSGEYFLALEGKNRKLKITLMKWTEYLCDFIDMINIPELCTHTPTIKRGHYGLLDVNAKLRIFSELVNQALETALVRKKLDEYIEKQLVLGATIRGEALKEGRKKREEKELSKTGSECNKIIDDQNVDTPENNLHLSAGDSHTKQDGDLAEKGNGEVFSSQQNGAVEMSDKNRVDAELEKMGKKQRTENMLETIDQSLKGDKEEVVKQLNGDYEAPKQLKGDKGKILKQCNGHNGEAIEQLKGDHEETRDKRNKEQRRDHFEREMEKLFVRTNPLGKDRHYNRYWWFRCNGRIFVESSDCQQWGYYSTKEELDALMGSLNCKGEREKALHGQIEKFYIKICSEIQKGSKELDNNTETEEAIVRRSTRVRAPPRQNPATAFMRYVNKWKKTD